MKKIFKNYLVFLLLAVTAIVFSNLLLEYLVNNHYARLVSNTEIIKAFQNQDPARIALVSSRYRLSYQRIQDNKVVYANHSNLPTPRLLNYNTESAKDVLKPDIIESLKSMTPYRMMMGRSLYLMFPLCQPTCSSNVYLIYSKVLP